MPFPVDNIYIDRATVKLGIRLPQSYVRYMQRSNGGEVDAAGETWQLFPVFDESDNNRIKRTCNDIVRETKVAREWAGFPPSGVAIASNGAGDKLVFLPHNSSESLADQIYWWDHETGNLTIVARKFGELVGE
jgi:hypothetical protein